jgi:hypothetical protein
VFVHAKNCSKGPSPALGLTGPEQATVSHGGSGGLA